MELLKSVGWTLLTLVGAGVVLGLVWWVGATFGAGWVLFPLLGAGSFFVTLSIVHGVRMDNHG